jgi:hypothetical protein
MSTKYRVKFSEKQPVLITRIFTMKDGERVEHTLSIEYEEAEAIAKAWLENEYLREFKRRF